MGGARVGGRLGMSIGRNSIRGGAGMGRLWMGGRRWRRTLIGDRGGRNSGEGSRLLGQLLGVSIYFIWRATLSISVHPCLTSGCQCFRSR